MRAQPGDWLVIERGDVEHAARRGHIEGVRNADGTPPYQVRWVDTDQVTLVFPGPDAHVVSAAELAEAESAARSRYARVQTEITRRAAAQSR